MLATDQALERLFRVGGLADTSFSTIAFNHRAESLEELWEGCLGGSVRTAEVVRTQGAARRCRIRAAFEWVVEHYWTEGGFEVPVSIRLVTGRRP